MGVAVEVTVQVTMGGSGWPRAGASLVLQQGSPPSAGERRTPLLEHVFQITGVFSPSRRRGGLGTPLGLHNCQACVVGCPSKEEKILCAIWRCALLVLTCKY